MKVIDVLSFLIEDPITHKFLYIDSEAAYTSENHIFLGNHLLSQA